MRLLRIPEPFDDPKPDRRTHALAYTAPSLLRGSRDRF
jgi:hypothetical protein